MADYNSVFGPYANQSEEDKKKNQSASQVARVENKQDRYDAVFGDAAKTYENIKSKWVAPTPTVETPVAPVSTPTKSTNLFDQLKSTLTGIINSVNPKREAEKKLAEVQAPQIDTSKIPAAGIQPIKDMGSLVAPAAGSQSAHMVPEAQQQLNEKLAPLAAPVMKVANIIDSKITYAENNIQNISLFGPKPAVSAENTDQVKQVWKDYQATPEAKANRYGSLFVGGVVQGASGSIVKPKFDKAPATIAEKVANGVGNVFGTVATMEAISSQFNKVMQGSTAVKQLIDKYPTVAKYAYPLIKNITTFDLYGQLDPDQENRFKTLLVDSVTAVPFSLIGFAGKARYTAPASFGLGYALAKLNGASDQDALISASIMAGFDLVTKVGNQRVTEESAKRIITKESLDTFNEIAGTKFTEKSSLEEMRQAYRKAATANHPDRGGSETTMTSLNVAWDNIRSMMGNQAVVKTETKSNTQPKSTIDEKSMIMSPDVAIDNVKGSDLDGTPAGMAILKMAETAKANNSDLVINPDVNGDLKTPSGNSFSIEEVPSDRKVEPKTETTPNLPASPEAPKQTESGAVVSQPASTQAQVTGEDIFKKPVDELVKTSAVSLSKDEFVNKALEYYKTTPDYLTTPETDKAWAVSVTKNTIVDHFNNMQKLDLTSKTPTETISNVSGQNNTNQVSTQPGVEVKTSEIPSGGQPAKAGGEKAILRENKASLRKINKIPKPLKELAVQARSMSSKKFVKEYGYLFDQQPDNYYKGTAKEFHATASIKKVVKPPTEVQKAQAEVAQQKRAAFDTETLKKISFVKRVMNLRTFAKGDVETLRKKYPTKVSDLVEAIRSVEFAPDLTDSEALDIAMSIPTEKETYPKYYPEADMGGYSDVQSRMKELENISAIEFPELLRMYQTLTNQVPVLKALRSYLGYHRAGGIVLNREIFKNPKIAIKVFAHEFGHLTDYFPDKTTSRGNLLGHIASLRKYMKTMLPESPTATEGALTPEDLDRLRKEAKAMMKKPVMEEQEVIVAEKPVTPTEIIAIWNDMNAGEKMPELMEYIKLLSEREKVEIVKGAIKGALPQWAKFSTLIKEKRLVEVMKDAPEDIKKKYQELVKEEIKKRKLFSVEEIKKELKDLTMLWKPFDPASDPGYTKYRYSGKEMYADAISVLFNDPALLKEKAPEFYRGFFNWMDNKPEVRDTFFDIQKVLNAGDEEIFKQRYAEIDKNYKTGEEKWAALEAEKQNNKKNLIHMLDTLFNDKNAAINRRVKEYIKKGGVVDPAHNPIYDLSGLNYMEGAVKEFVANNFQPAVAHVANVVNGWSDVGKILQLERAVGERGDLANPGGYDPKTAKWTLDQMEKHTAPEDWKKLREAVSIFRKGVEKFNAKAREEGFYTPELQKQIEENKFYSAFQVLDYLDTHVSSHVYKQKGTLKGIANPATTTVMKVVSTLRAMRYNRSKIENIDFLKLIDGEIEPAKLRFNGRSMAAVPPKDRTKDLVMTIRNGKYEGVYVNKEVGMILNHNEEPTLRALAAVSRAISGAKFYRPIFTGLNLGFQMFNFKKDFDRTWRNMPDKNILDAVKSLPKVIAGYAKASPVAWDKARGIENPTVTEMEKMEIFGINRNELYGQVNPDEDQMTRVLRKIGALPEPEGRSKLRKLVYPIVKLGDALELFGNYIEALPKVSGYTNLKGKMNEKELAYYVRNYLGSPDFLVGGTATPITNNMFLFSNAIKEGMKADLNMAFTAKSSRGAWWFKMLLGTVIPKLLQIALAGGLMGVGMKKMFDNISEYDKTNYDIIPLGLDKNGKTQYIRVPKDESGRFIGAFTWKAFNLMKSEDKQSLLSNLSDIFSLGAGQFPNLTPSITGATALISYLSGNNPWDNFRNRNVVPDTAFKAGFKESWPYMLQWLANSQGMSIVIPAYKVEDAQASTLEKLINLPILSNMLGRFVRVSDYGQQEIDNRIKSEIEMQNAQKTLRRNEAIDAATKRGTPPTLTEINSVLGHALDVKNKDDVAEVQSLMKKYEVQSIKGKNVFLDNLIYAGSNDAKVLMLQRYQKELTGQEFYDLVKTASDYKIVSSDALKQFSEAQQQDKGKGLLNFDFNLVKEAHAAENIPNLANKLTWTKDVRSGIEKFLNKAQAIITGNPNYDKPQEGIQYSKLNSDQRREYYQTMLTLRQQDPQWYYDNIGNTVEKRILGFDLGTKETVIPILEKQKKEALATPTPTKVPDLKTLATPTVEDIAPTDTPYNDQIKKIFEDKWVEATKVLRRTDADGVIRGENTQLLSGPEIDVPNHIDPATGKWDSTKPVVKYKNKFTGDTDESTDRGLFRINNRRLFGKDGILGGKVERQAMIDKGLLDSKYADYSKITPEVSKELWDKMLNPEDNIKMAKVIYDIGGWKGWFAAPKEYLK